MSDTVFIEMRVDAAPERAFRLFTDDIAIWWRSGGVLSGAQGKAARVRLEPGPQGALTEYDEAGARFELARIRLWDPPRRLILAWRLPNIAAERTSEVEIRFEKDGTGTRVHLAHRGLDALRPGHDARHGLAASSLHIEVGRLWRDALSAYRAHAEQ